MELNAKIFAECDENKSIFLYPGDFYFGDGATRLRTVLGSCIAVALWHPGRQMGGMSHAILPSRERPHDAEGLDPRYADEAVELFLREVRRHGLAPGEFRVTLFGGSEMFSANRPHHLVASGDRNVETGVIRLEKAGFRIGWMDVSGNGHLDVILELHNGNISLHNGGSIR